MMSFQSQSGNSFIDENHNGILNNINAIAETTRGKWNSSDFHTKVSVFITDLENHFSHEEVILKAKEYKDLNSHSIHHRELSIKFRISSMKVTNRQDSINFVANFRSYLFNHELLVDQQYWHLFEDLESENNNQLIEWTEDLVTGDTETDQHHRALVNHINKLHLGVFQSDDNHRAYDELMLLHDYSRFHFGKEELSLGRQLRPGHKENHHQIIVDLQSVADEVKQGKFKPRHLGDYLKYWMTNHIKIFDVPSFNKEDP